MRSSKFSVAQKAFILKQGDDGVPVAEICRKAGIRQATHFDWRKTFAGLLPTEMKRLKQLEDENARLRTLVADLSLDKEMLQDVVRRKLVRRCFSDHWRFICSLCPEARAGGRDLPGVGRVYPQGVRRSRAGSLDLPLPVPPPRTGPAGDPHQGDLRDAGAVWRAARPSAAAPGGLDDQSQKNKARLQ